MVNAALVLRRPLLVTGPPGCGKSSLAFAVAEELDLGPVLHWPITTRTTLTEGLYHYDAIARLHAASLAASRQAQGGSKAAEAEEIGRFIRLGPLGTALLSPDPQRPRVLLIDEIDKSDIDLPNDLLHFFEEGQFEIPELKRQHTGSEEPIEVQVHGSEERASVKDGQVQGRVFPFVVMTSNEERAFSPAFLRRCLRLEIRPPGEADLADIVRRHFDERSDQLGQESLLELVRDFIGRRNEGASLATDQLLNVIHLLLGGADLRAQGGEADLQEAILRSLSE